MKTNEISIKKMSFRDKKMIMYFVEYVDNELLTGWLVKNDVENLLNEIKKDLETPRETPEEWIDEWLKMWPKGVKSMGKLVRSDLAGCLKKMTEFTKEHTYDKSIIFKATRAYLMDRYRHNWEAIRCATYFISKKEGKATTSDLVAWCEQVLNPIDYDHEMGNKDMFRKSINQ